MPQGFDSYFIKSELCHCLCEERNWARFSWSFPLLPFLKQ